MSDSPPMQEVKNTESLLRCKAIDLAAQQQCPCKKRENKWS
jgi:hypothetical protein